MKETNLIPRFIAYSIAAFLVTAVLLSTFLVKYIENDKVNDALAVTRLSVNLFIGEALEKTDFAGLSPDKLQSLTQLMTRMKANSTILDVRIWSKEGQVVFSSDQSIIGKWFDDPELMEALEGKHIFEIISPTKDENINLSTHNHEVIEIYEPIRIDGKIAGAFEIYQPFDEIRRQINHLSIVIAFITFIGLIVLYILLLRIIYRVSQQMLWQNKELEHQQKKLLESYEKINDSYEAMTLTLSNAVDARDPYTAGHSQRVTEISLLIGKAMDLNETELATLERAARFHDIGKIGIPDSVLLKTEALTTDEYSLIKTHSAIGETILSNAEFMHDALKIIRSHHERPNGSGYPDGLKGEAIPPLSRIISVADSYDAMTSDRPYRNKKSHASALDELAEHSGTQFDPLVVGAFMIIESALNSD